MTDWERKIAKKALKWRRDLRIVTKDIAHQRMCCT
jgi:hypothetical protein